MFQKFPATNKIFYKYRPEELSVIKKMPKSLK